MSYESDRYKQGLSGKRPGWIVLDETGHRAQTAGYEAHLRNKDLVDQIRQNESSGESYYCEPSPDEPLLWWQKLFWWALASPFIIAGLLGLYNGILAVARHR